MAKRVAVVGSREFPHLEEVVKYVGRLPPGTVVVSGGARGVDYVAASAAARFGMEAKIFPPNRKKYGNSAYAIRNQQIVDYSDMVIVFWDGRSPGTLDVMTRARKARKLEMVFGVNIKGE